MNHCRFCKCRACAFCQARLADAMPKMMREKKWSRKQLQEHIDDVPRRGGRSVFAQWEITLGLDL